MKKLTVGLLAEAGSVTPCSGFGGAVGADTVVAVASKLIFLKAALLRIREKGAALELATQPETAATPSPFHVYSGSDRDSEFNSNSEAPCHGLANLT